MFKPFSENNLKRNNFKIITTTKMQYLPWFNKKPWYYCQKAKNKPKNGTI
jgi:hypothetical protein